jgi:hypothetical protein
VLDYLLKPFDDARFALALGRAKDRVRRVVGRLRPEAHGMVDGTGWDPRYCVPSAYQVRNSAYLGISSELALGSMATWTTPTLPLA